ncbi:hypothetical protein FB45DRAFT_1053406 [Roridomyces roridus]|uniref:Uncharacterized protein n=1 Tax=Roridomyces roridus TaxID=1738132 RepID=A0AAD7CCH6_9AGAR|nr:hypothetical protein FB45DRAFT_1053406 [Roridomyces roridus]
MSVGRTMYSPPSSTLRAIAAASGDTRSRSFVGVDYDVRLEPILSCVSPERPTKYEVITAGEYIQGQLSAIYGH